MSLRAAPDIRSPADVDPMWLTQVLQAGGVDAVVKSFTAKPVGTGQLGESVRFSLAYHRETDAGPRSLVGKFPSSGEESRNAGVSLGNYVREVRFYQTLASTALIRTPRCYFTDVDETTSNFVLMMEDLAPAEQGDQLTGVTLDQAKLVVIEAAKLHASHWDDATLDHLPWVSGSKAAPTTAATWQTVSELWEGFKTRYQSSLESRWIQVGDRLIAHYPDLGARHDGPRCLTHNDFRPDNMMFASSQGGHPVTVLDWQSFAYGAGATDLAYFLAGALEPQSRRAAEPALLALYHSTLLGHGVLDYTMEQLHGHYAQGGYLLFLTAFFAAMIVTQTPRGDLMFLRMLSGAADHMLDHDPLS